MERSPCLNRSDFIVVDASSSEGWEFIDSEFWVLSVGRYTPKFADSVNLEKGDIELLVDYACMIVSDTRRLEELCKDMGTVFVYLPDLKDAKTLVEEMYLVQ